MTHIPALQPQPCPHVLKEERIVLCFGQPALGRGVPWLVLARRRPAHTIHSGHSARNTPTSSACPCSHLHGPETGGSPTSSKLNVTKLPLSSRNGRKNDATRRRSAVASHVRLSAGSSSTIAFLLPFVQHSPTSAQDTPLLSLAAPSTTPNPTGATSNHVEDSFLACRLHGSNTAVVTTAKFCLPISYRLAGQITAGRRCMFTAPVRTFGCIFVAHLRF